MRRAAKVDDNQDEIVKALRKIGAKVEIIGKPLDLLIWFRQRTFLIEVKNLDGRDRLTKDQVEFIAAWPGELYVVHTPAEAVELVIGREAMR